MVSYIAPPLVPRRRWNRHDAPLPRACNGLGKLGRWIVQLRQDRRLVAFAQTEPYTATPMAEGAEMANTTPQTGYAPVNNLNI